MEIITGSRCPERAWSREAVARLNAEESATPRTELLKFALPHSWGIDLYLKDESTLPTGSLKHRLARALFLYGICNGKIRSGTEIFEASSGSTAVSEAYFARLLGLPFTAVMPASVSPEKIRRVEEYGGSCHLIEDAANIAAVARDLAGERGGHFMDQFTFAERATGWNADTGLAAELVGQLSEERYPEPAWVVMGAGTGGTTATLGRHLRYRGYATRICVVDPEGSAFYPAWRDHDPEARGSGSRIEGIGRPRVEASFLPEIIDHMISVPDAASIAAMRFLARTLPVDPGGSTGTNLWGALHLARAMADRGETGSIVTLICDGGERYRDTYYDAGWLARAGIDPEPSTAILRDLLLETR